MQKSKFTVKCVYSTFFVLLFFSSKAMQNYILYSKKQVCNMIFSRCN